MDRRNPRCRQRLALSIHALCVGLISAVGASNSTAFLTADDFFRDPTVLSVTVSPTGEFFAVEVWGGGSSASFEDNEIATRNTAVFIRHIGSKTTKKAIEALGMISWLGWVDDDTLLVRYASGDETYVSSIDVAFTDDDLAFKIDPIRTPGWVTDGIPDQKDEVLWAYTQKGQSIVYRAPLSELKAYEPEKGRKARQPWKGLDPKYIVAQMEGYVPWWITDRNGNVRAAVSVEGQRENAEVTLEYRESPDAPWREIYRTDDVDQMYIPVGMASDNHNLLVLSDEGRDTRALIELKVDSGELGQILYSHPNADVEAIIYDFNGDTVLAAEYQESGVRRYHHFDAFSDRFQRSLEHAFPGQSVAITSSSRDSRFFSVLVSNPKDAGTFYILDTQERIADFVGHTMPWLDSNSMADARMLEVTASDGTKIEAFLTIPVDLDGELPPLLVLPHGGPYGVRDSLSFDPLVQYIASWGIAVLQVNFRGSAGYGRSFLEAGYRERAKGIEDDIESAVELVIANGLIDPNRMCIGGISYGGFSAIVSAIRFPDQYICAVTIAGISDLPLQLRSTAQRLTDKGQEEFNRMFGDPTTEYEELISISPAYHATEIKIPVLIVHGTEDRRVDVENAYRLKAMLDAHGKPYSWYLLNGAGHSFSTGEWLKVARALVLFVNDYVNPLKSEEPEVPES